MNKNDKNENENISGTPSQESTVAATKEKYDNKAPIICALLILTALVIFLLGTTIAACYKAERTDYPIQKTKIVKVADASSLDDCDVVATDNTITVQAESKADAVPDRASFDIDIEARASTSEKATQKLNSMTSNITGIIKSSLISVDKYSTDSLDIRPVQDYREDDASVKEYQASTTISVNNISIKKAEKVYSAVGKLAGDSDSKDTISLGYFSTTCSDYDKVYNEALEKAVKRAREKADAIAEASGLEVKFAKTVTEGYESDSGYNAYTDNTSEAATNAISLPSSSSESVSISEGSKKITAEVTATFVVG